MLPGEKKGEKGKESARGKHAHYFIVEIPVGVGG